MEVYNSDLELKSFLLSDIGLTDIEIGVSSENYYYLSGMLNNQPSLIKVDPSGFPHNALDLLPSGQYDIFNIIVSPDDEVTFNALHMADGNIVIGQISSTGELKKLEEQGNEVIQMVQVQILG